ncbi:MAG: Nif11-like leader peptide family natural product precursor [Planctomycetota bacterium]|nr:MAG: Nif11-like leader peptide family natural product precursor [Planctomycetota bacterium]
MSNEEQLTAFLDKVESDAALQEEVRKVKSVSDLVALGKQSGFSFDEDTAKSYFQEQAQSGGDVELSEDGRRRVLSGRGLWLLCLQVHSRTPWRGAEQGWLSVVNWTPLTGPR